MIVGYYRRQAGVRRKRNVNPYLTTKYGHPINSLLPCAGAIQTMPGPVQPTSQRVWGWFASRRCEVICWNYVPFLWWILFVWKSLDISNPFNDRRVWIVQGYIKRVRIRIGEIVLWKLYKGTHHTFGIPRKFIWCPVGLPFVSSHKITYTWRKREWKNIGNESKD